MKRIVSKMKRGSNGRCVYLGLLFLLALSFLAAGCGDGSDGSAGAQGPEGPAGPPGPVTTTDESCVVCHGEGTIVDTAVFMPPPPPSLTVTITAVTDVGDGQFLAAFTVTDEDDEGVAGFELGGNRFYINDIVPAGTATASWGTWDTDYLERWAYERDRTGFPLGTWTDLGGGNYTYLFATLAGSTEALAEAPDYSPTHVQRVIIRVDGRDDGFGRAIGIQDFMVDGTLLDPQRVLAPTDGCKKCHSPEMDRAAHAGGYLDTRACAMCHSPIGNAEGDEMQEDDAWSTLLFHKLHAAIPMPAFPNRIQGRGYGAVTLPQPVNDCVICHTGNDYMTDAFLTNPTAEACGACHEDPKYGGVNFVTGENHPGGPQLNNNACFFCHPAAKTATDHDPAPEAKNVSEYDVTITMTPPANTEYYVAGETPKVTVTLATGAGPVVGTVYTDNQRPEGITSITLGLSLARVYVYGPRALAVPVLTTGSTTDPNFDPETDTARQAHDLWLANVEGVSNADPLVMSDSSGYVYQLLAIPDDLEPGTYMARFEGAGYGGISSTDYVTSSSAVITFQVGTADVEDKVAGDGCLKCHGDTIMHLEGSHAHHAAFDTDGCLGCHDQSDNYAVPIANRVHAVHSANGDGDLYTIEERGYRDWSWVTYPSDIGKCVVCHTSGDDSYQTNPFEMPCSGCHVVEGNEVIDHMRQMGGPF